MKKCYKKRTKWINNKKEMQCNKYRTSIFLTVHVLVILLMRPVHVWFLEREEKMLASNLIGDSASVFANSMGSVIWGSASEAASHRCCPSDNTPAIIVVLICRMEERATRERRVILPVIWADLLPHSQRSSKEWKFFLIQILRINNIYLCFMLMRAMWFTIPRRRHHLKPDVKLKLNK